MTEAFDSPTVLALKYLFGLAGTISCSLLIKKILFDIELNQFKRSVAPEVEKNLSELSLSTTNSLSDDADDASSKSNNSPKKNKSVIQKSLSGESDSSDTSYMRKKRIHRETKIGIFFNVSLLTFLNYLLMVYLPSGVMPSLVAMTCLTAILLRAQLIEDMRRKRFDRISTIFTLLIFMAGFLSLCTYATIGKREGGVYEGPARIVGYDVTNYNNKKEDNVLRTDLEVEWGGKWGCPDTPQQQCHAYVSGALCEVKDENARRMKKRGRKKGRVLKKKKSTEEEAAAEDETEAEVEAAEEVVVEAEDAVEEVAEEAEDEVEDTAADTTDGAIEEDNAAEESSETTDADTDTEASIETYYKEAAKDFVTEVGDEVDQTAEEEKLYYVEDIQIAQEELAEDENDTSADAAEIEKKVEDTENAIAHDIENVKNTTIGAGSANDPDGQFTSEAINAETSDVEALEQEVEDLKKKIEELEEEDIEEQEVEVITEDTAEYYAGQEKNQEGITEELEDENDELVEDIDYYADKAEDESEENQELLNANEDLAEKNEVLTEEVIEAENAEPKTEEIITITYYPEMNGTNATGEYYVYETEETVPINSNAYSSGMDDDFAYTFEDDIFEDEYWGYDWDSAWGDYACNDLFETDLESVSYNEDEAPGNDDYPFVTIYGSCNSCKAFLVDYYSTAHFDKIREYQKHAWTYVWFGFFSMIVTGALKLKQYLRPAEENQIDLLMSDGGQFV